MLDDMVYLDISAPAHSNILAICLTLHQLVLSAPIQRHSYLRQSLERQTVICIKECLITPYTFPTPIISLFLMGGQSGLGLSLGLSLHRKLG